SLLVGSRFDQRGAGHFIAHIGLDQTHTLRAATGLTDFSGLEPDELALLGDDHDLRLIFHRKNCNNLPGLLGRLHVDDALTTARLQPVSRDRSLLAVTLLGN